MPRRSQAWTNRKSEGRRESQAERTITEEHPDLNWKVISKDGHWTLRQSKRTQWRDW